MFEIDTSFIYLKDQHSFFHSWVACNNPASADFAAITGYIKMSCAVIGPGDPQVTLSDDAGPAQTDKDNILMPPSAKKEFYQLKLRFFRAEKFPKMDRFGTIDAYVKLDYYG